MKSGIISGYTFLNQPNVVMGKKKSPTSRVKKILRFLVFAGIFFIGASAIQASVDDEGAFAPIFSIVAAIQIDVTSESTFNGWEHIVIGQSGGGADGTDLADIDFDGDMDVVTGYEGQGLVEVYTNPGDTSAWGKTVVCTGCVDVEDAHFVDLDGDGDFDVVSSREGNSQKVTVSWNDAGVWNRGNIKATKDLGIKWMVSDHAQIDGKNGVDLLMGSKGKAGYYWLEAPIDPRDMDAWVAHKIGEGKWTMGLIARDMDEDGDTDLVFSDKNQRVGWFENPGVLSDQTQPWTEHLIGKGQNVRWMDLKDVNGDGRDDAVVANSHNDVAITWWERPTNVLSAWTRHDVRFTPETNFTTKHAKAVTVGDMNNDGKNDLVVVTRLRGHIAYWLSYVNSPDDSQWKGELIYDKGRTKFDEVQVLDQDGDGDLDVITSAEGKFGVGWFQNNIISTPTPPPPPPPPGSPPTVTLSASPTSVSSGGSSTLTWTTTNSPTSCTASGDWSGSKNVSSGSEVQSNITLDKTYTLTCSNSDGSASDSATVTVDSAPPPPPPPDPDPDPTTCDGGTYNVVLESGAKTLHWRGTWPTFQGLIDAGECEFTSSASGLKVVARTNLLVMQKGSDNTSNDYIIRTEDGQKLVKWNLKRKLPPTVQDMKDAANIEFPGISFSQLEISSRIKIIVMRKIL